MRLALAQLNTTVGDFRGNGEKIAAALARAEEAGAHLLAVPELAVCGYPPRDLIDRPAFQREAARTLRDLARRTGETALLVGTFLPNPRTTGKPFHNAAVLLHRGRTRAVAKKLLLPTYDVFDEGRHFEPGGSPVIVPLAGERLGLSICEDLWNDKDFWRARRLYREDPGEEMVRRGATAIVNVSASPFSEGKPRLRRRMLARLARDGRVPVAYVNLVGGNDELVFDGGTIVLDGRGRVAARGTLFDEDLLVVDLTAGRKPRGVVPLSGRRRADLADDAEGSALESLRRALVLGIRDYARKCGFASAILGLSGGIDSALVAALAVDALGAANVTGFGLPSPFSSEGSVADARDLAANLGIRFEILPIDGLFAEAKRALAPLFSGRPEDVTEENIQSRLRGLLLMAVSNKFGPLVLTTGNKSELAVGYCTLYGDMCGGLAPISDLPKTRVYALARHLNARAGRPLIPSSSLTKPPSAELRPDQTDQDSLPPYDLLDAILESLVERGLSVETTARRAGAPLPLVKGIAHQLDRAEYKRAQAAPGLKVSMKAFGTGRRIPIAQRSPA
ncbi:MAG TPA: NAD+ synthase [Thermoanaerobaculia bacterium]|nr:NAD+ synthase [Thermoanaerobaculia bacterium]HQR67620.1 NAD+ synthase [Thermoanaerobaculia bacterium]